MEVCILVKGLQCLWVGDRAAWLVVLCPIHNVFDRHFRFLAVECDRNTAHLKDAVGNVTG